MKKLLIFFALLISILTSCSNDKVEYLIEGQWIVTNLYYKGNNYTDSIMLNSLIINPHSKLFGFPNLNMSYNFDKLGVFEFLNNNSETYIKVYDNIKEINGIHKLTFKRDTTNQYLVMILSSKNVYVVAIKNRFNYLRRKNYIDDLPVCKLKKYEG